MARFCLQTIFVLVCILYTVSGAPKGKAKANGNNNNNNVPTGKNPCSGDVRTGDPCNITLSYEGSNELVSWTGICAYIHSTGETPGHQLCMPACGEPDLDPADNLVPGQTTTGPYSQGTIFVVECDEYYAAAPGSGMEIVCVGGYWTDFAGECLAECMALDPTTVDPNAVDDSPHGNLEGDVALLDCGPGFIAQGTLTATCTDHSWVPDEENGECVSSCQPPDPAVVTLSDAELNIPDVTFTVDDVILFTCDPGYVAIGCNYAICLADGSWGVEGPGCTQTCDPVVGNEFGVNAAPTHVPATPILVGYVLEYDCDPGWTETGSMTLTCAAGFWSPSGGPCVQDCGPVPVPCNTALAEVSWTPADGDTTLGAIVTYSCATGYFADPSAPVLTCTSGGWQLTGSCTPGCDPDTAPTGYVSDDGLTATEKCDDDVTVHELACDVTTGVWKTPTETCPDDCINVYPPTGYGNNDGTTATLTCDDGVTILTVTCDTGTFTWGPPDGTCPNDCINVDPPTGYGNNDGTTATLTCDDGVTVLTVACDAGTFTWGPPDGTCPDDCINVDPPTGYGNNDGTTATLTCDDGVTVLTVTCDTGTFTWGPPDGTCPNDCINVDPPTGYGNNDGTTATLTCDDGVTVLTVTCDTGTFTWGPPDGTCPDDCINVDPPTGYGNNDGTTATLTCDDGVTVLTVTCDTGTFTWGPPDGTCPDDCINVDPPTGYGNNDGTTATLTCDDSVTVLTVTCDTGTFTWGPPDGTCPECGDAPDYHEIPGAVSGPVVTGNTAAYTCDSETSLEETATATCDGTKWIIDEPGCNSVTQSCDDAIQDKLKPSVNKCQQYLDHCYCPLETEYDHADALTACMDLMKTTETGLDMQLAVADTTEELLWMWTFGGYAINGQSEWWTVYKTDGSGVVESVYAPGDPLPFVHPYSPTSPPPNTCGYFMTGDTTSYTDAWVFVSCDDSNDKKKSICEISLSTP